MAIEKQLDIFLLLFAVVPGTVFSLLTPYCELSFGVGPVCVWDAMEVVYHVVGALYGILLVYLFWLIIPLFLLALLVSTLVKLRDIGRYGWRAVAHYPYGYIVWGLTIAHLTVLILLLARSFSYALPPLP
jgi:hypothetical protein